MNAIMSVQFYIPAEGTRIDLGRSKTKLALSTKEMYLPQRDKSKE